MQCSAVRACWCCRAPFSFLFFFFYFSTEPLNDRPLQTIRRLTALPSTIRSVLTTAAALLASLGGGGGGGGGCMTILFRATELYSPFYALHAGCKGVVLRWWLYSSFFIIIFLTLEKRFWRYSQSLSRLLVTGSFSRRVTNNSVIIIRQEEEEEEEEEEDTSFFLSSLFCFIPAAVGLCPISRHRLGLLLLLLLRLNSVRRTRAIHGKIRAHLFLSNLLDSSSSSRLLPAATADWRDR